MIKLGFIQSNIDFNEQNIALLGFKMGVNEGLTVFNLVDGIVDEFMMKVEQTKAKDQMIYTVLQMITI